MSEWYPCSKCNIEHENMTECPELSISQPEDEKMTTPNLDALVEKWYLAMRAQSLDGPQKNALKQCALEWAKEVQSTVDNMQKGEAHLIQVIDDRDQWKARAEKAEVFIDRVGFYLAGNELNADQANKLSQQCLAELKEAKG